MDDRWEGDLPDKRGKHRRRAIKHNKGRIRQYLKRITKQEIRERELVELKRLKEKYEI